MKIGKFFRVGVALGLASCVLVATQPGYASSDPLAEDVASYLSSESVTSTSSNSGDLPYVPNVNEFVDWVSNAYKTSFVGYLPADEQSNPTLIFTDEVPLDVKLRAANEGLEFDSYVNPDAVALDDLRDTQTLLMRQLAVEFPGAIFTSVISTSGEIKGSVIELQSNLGGEIAREVNLVISKDSLNINITPTNVIYDTHEVRVTTTLGVIGGGQLLGGSGTCTGAFTATRYGVAGIASAAHCSGLGTNPTYNGVSVTSTESSAQVRGDAGWFRLASGTTISNSMKYNPAGSVRTISSKADLLVGDPVCYYGRTTGYGCKTVQATGVCIGNLCGLALSTPSTVLPGDSGGPWFFGQQANGVTYGYLTAGSAQFDISTQISAFASFSVQIKTTP
jgi:hypothetical protein